MPDVMTQFSTVSTDAPAQYIAKRMYELAERQMVLGRYATRYELPQRMGTTLRAVRVGRLNLPRTTLTEGVPPDAVALSLTNQDVTVQQWGIVVLLTDVAEITTVHPMLTKAIERTSLAMAEMFEREMAETIIAGTNVTFANARTTRATITAGDNISTAEMIGIITTLRRRGAGPIRGSLYGGVLPPQLEADMMGEAAFRDNVSRGQDLERLDFAKIGNWMGAEWVRSNFLPFFQGVAAPNGAAITAEKAQLVGVAGGTAYDDNATVVVRIVAREVTTDYERLLSLESSFAIGVGAQTFNVVLPSDTDYTYDVYAPSAIGGTAPRLHTSRAAASATVSITTRPATTAAQSPALVEADDRDVFIAWVFGSDAFGRVELNGMSMRSYLTPAGASYSNPLAQGRKIGNKVMWNSWILDNDFFQRFESESAYASGLP